MDSRQHRPRSGPQDHHAQWTAHAPIPVPQTLDDHRPVRDALDLVEDHHDAEGGTLRGGAGALPGRHQPFWPGRPSGDQDMGDRRNVEWWPVRRRVVHGQEPARDAGILKVRDRLQDQGGLPCLSRTRDGDQPHGPVLAEEGGQAGHMRASVGRQVSHGLKSMSMSKNDQWRTSKAKSTPSLAWRAEYGPAFARGRSKRAGRSVSRYWRSGQGTQTQDLRVGPVGHG